MTEVKSALFVSKKGEAPPQWEDFEDYALILAAHGDRGGKARNTQLMTHQVSLSQMANFRCVTAGVLKGDPTLEEAVLTALQSGARKLLVYPMFMADGYFNKTILPQRLQALSPIETFCILPPLGLDPSLPSFLLSYTLTFAQKHTLDPRTAHLLIVGHGSKLGPASAHSTKAVAESIMQHKMFSSVETAFLEEEEFLEDALLRKRANTIVLGFFSGDGMHASEDVTEFISSTGSTALYAGSLGSFPQFPAFLLSSITSALRKEVLART